MKAVYLITNTINGREYIGASSDVNKRIASHLSSIKSLKHQNDRIRADSYVYDHACFVVNVLKSDFVTTEEMLLFELKMLLIKNPFYNMVIRKKVGNRGIEVINGELINKSYTPEDSSWKDIKVFSYNDLVTDEKCNVVFSPHRLEMLAKKKLL